MHCRWVQVAPCGRTFDRRDTAKLLTDEQDRQFCQFCLPLRQVSLAAASRVLSSCPPADFTTARTSIVQPNTVVSADAGKFERPGSLKKASFLQAQGTPSPAGLIEVDGGQAEGYLVVVPMPRQHTEEPGPLAGMKAQARAQFI